MNSLEFEPGDFKPEIEIASPGRINLIGEHTDYNKGFVFPAAIDKKIIFGIRKNGSPSLCRVYSADFERLLEFDLGEVKQSSLEWENFILGVIFEIQNLDRQLKGFDCVIKSSLPIGAGLSSSAAMECGLAFGLNELFDLKLSRLEMALLSQRAEHNFVGTQCGIMDQYASLMGLAGQALLLDCESVTHVYIPVDLAPYELILLNTKVSHSLATGEYNLRRADCFEGVEIMRSKAGYQVRSLRDVSEDQLVECRDLLPTRIYGRCNYVIQENKRVIEAAEALREKNLGEFGKLLYASHEGLQNEYEVSCDELDFLVDFSRDKPYVLGSRMMGGGFGGCTLNLVHEERVDQYVSEVSAAYKNRFDIEIDAIPVSPARGTHIIQ